MAKDRRFELRIASDLLDRVDAKRGDASRAAFITSALERALSSGERSTGGSPRSSAQPPSVAAPVRAPKDAQRPMSNRAARQAKLNKAKGMT